MKETRPRIPSERNARQGLHFLQGLRATSRFTSKSLDELAANVKSIEPSSVKFHVEEGDFENWFTMLGDKSLAGQVAALRGKKISPNKLKEKVSSMVNKRVDQLHKIASSKEKQCASVPCKAG